MAMFTARSFWQTLTSILEDLAYIFTFLGALAGVSYVVANRHLQRIVNEDLRQEREIHERTEREMQAKILAAQNEQERIKQENLQLSINLERERLARLQLSQKVAPRDLTHEQQHNIATAIARFGRQKVELDKIMQ